MHQTFPCRLLEIGSGRRRFVARLCRTLLAEVEGAGGRHVGPYRADHTAGRQCLQRAQPRWPMGQQHALPVLRYPRTHEIPRLPAPPFLFAGHRSPVLLQHESVRWSTSAPCGAPDEGEVQDRFQVTTAVLLFLDGTLRRLVDTEHEGITIFRNFGKALPVDKT